MKKNFDDVFKDHRYFIKGDISGIQEYLFNVKSQGAAKTLRARSFVIYALGILAADLVKTTLDGENDGNVVEMYNGGGNFYLFCKAVTPTQIETIRREIDLTLREEDLQLSLTFTSYDPGSDTFSDVWKKVNRDSSHDKLRRFWTTPEAFKIIRAFEVMEPSPDISTVLTSFGTSLAKDQTTGYLVTEEGKQRIEYRKISYFGRGFQLNGKDERLKRHIIAQVPRNKDLAPEYAEMLKNDISPDDPIGAGDVLTFSAMAAFAAYRTGLEKLGVLKLDLDHLGSKFNLMDTANEAAKLSHDLDKFFSETITDLWEGKFTFISGETKESGSAVFAQNVSVIYSGGDDCMVVGAWDAVFEFALVVQKAFEKNIKTNYPDLTISGGLIMVDSKFPVVRFADLVEEAISEAKNSNGEDKNRFSFMGEILTWEEFAKCKSIAHKVRDLIVLHNEPRSIIERIARSAVGFAKAQDKAKSQNLRTAQVWKLLYYVRQSKNREEIIKEVIDEYTSALLKAVVSAKGAINPQVFPLAARWAELLTRKKRNDVR